MSLSLKEKIKTIFTLALPNALALFLGQVPQMVNLAVIGQQYDTTAVNAVGLCTIVIQMIPYTLMYGFNGALDTFLSQAFGAKEYQTAGHYINTAKTLMLCFFIPLVAVFMNTGSILIEIG